MEKNLPDRKDVQEELTWRLEDIYPEKSQFDSEMEEAARLVRDSLVSCGHAEGEDRLNRSPEGNGDED